MKLVCYSTQEEDFLKNMIISPLYEMMIKLEDSGELSLESINATDRNVSRGVIGKMEAMKLVVKAGNPAKYSMSEKGYKFLNSILDAIHNPIVHWDKKWRLISFSIPESERPKRDKLRSYLEGLGFKAILKGLWISPLDLSREVLSFAEKMNLKKGLVFVESDKVSGFTDQEIADLWDFDKFRNLYEEFIADAQAFPKNSNSYEIKKMIFKFALILNNEPNVPIELFPNDWPKFRANLLYKKIRRQIQ